MEWRAIKEYGRPRLDDADSLWHNGVEIGEIEPISKYDADENLVGYNYGWRFLGRSRNDAGRYDGIKSVTSWETIDEARRSLELFVSEWLKSF